MILIDGGDFGDAATGAYVWKTVELFNAMRTMGYDVIGLGEKDLAPAFLTEAAQNGAAQILLSGNLKPAVDVGAEPIRLIQRKSYQVGVVEAISSFLQQGHALEPKDPKTFLQTQLEILRQKKADLIVVIYHGPANEVLALRQGFPEVDLWLLSHGTYQPMNQVQTTDGGAIVIGAGDRGREVGFITIEKVKKSGARTAKFNQIILDNRIPDSPKAAPILENFRKRSQSPPQAPSPPTQTQPQRPQSQPQSPSPSQSPSQPQSLPPELSANTYVGSEVCKLCHEQIYGKWRDSKHARALEVLVANGQATNPKCLRCHTVGFGEQNGYDIKNKQPYLAGVGCEMCHGRAGDHVRADDQTNNFAKTTQATCLRCHDKENSPKFVYAEYLTRVH
ncbi:MAG: multiheme c-type cytochrome [candidate division KSB1 bacterium]|nr:multiheme c-type cytochrome [candidate division KSB1 bacterium]MDZ7310380.1 multiheme c-type cytochrome [candidate division KSB1 bacterium]